MRMFSVTSCCSSTCSVEPKPVQMKQLDPQVLVDHSVVRAMAFSTPTTVGLQKVRYTCSKGCSGSGKKKKPVSVPATKQRCSVSPSISVSTPQMQAPLQMCAVSPDLSKSPHVARKTTPGISPMISPQADRTGGTPVKTTPQPRHLHLSCTPESYQCGSKDACSEIKLRSPAADFGWQYEVLLDQLRCRQQELSARSNTLYT
jgi:hypothetical protein